MSVKTSSRSAESEPATPASPGGLAGPWGLRLLVFVSGAVLMGLEIVGSRILAPYFGNSVFVWGSLISLFLIALSLGYYFGGRLSDHRPSRRLLSGIVIAVGASLFVVAAIAQPVCNAILLAGFGEQSGPLLAATALFLIPSIGMGMVSPLSVRLGASSMASVGRTAGTLYALSTIGSIAGTMITTFALIPSIGAGAILKGLAATLLATGVIAYPFATGLSAVQGIVAALVAAIAATWAVGTTRAELPPGQQLVHDANTPYHHLSVIDDAIHGERQLRFDRFIESSIELAEPHRGRTDYTYYFHLAFLAQPKIERALFIGAGGGVGPRSFLMHNPRMSIDVVDIDAKVLVAARDHFYMNNDRQTRSIAADGRSFVRQAKRESYDCIVLDAFTIGGRIPFHLVSREFFELCRARLAPGGVFVMNINSAERGPRSAIYRSMRRTIEAAFGESTAAFVLFKGRVPPETSTNVILLAMKDGPSLSREQWLAKAREYTSASYVGQDVVERMIESWTPDPVAADAPIFTDDYAPIETMAF